jgi:H+/Cl- antiporter ClcA
MPSFLAPGARASIRRPFASFLSLSCGTLVVGVAAGLAAMALGLLLHLIQHMTYGLSTQSLVGGPSFLQEVDRATPARRFGALCLAGLVAGTGWYGVYRKGRPLVSVAGAVKGDGMPCWSTLAHALLQIVTVAMGSPLGREVAPREVGALLAQKIAKGFGLAHERVNVLAACGAGAGLAAIYNVPMAGALFVLEVLVQEVSALVAVQALVACFLATWVARLGLGDETQYHVGVWKADGALLIWALLAGPVLGLAGGAYRALTARMRSVAPRDRRIVPLCLAAFAMTGVMAMGFPEIPGNGKGPLQLGLLDQVPLRFAIVLVILKLLATAACLRAGAQGGLLTPGLTIGGLLSVVLAYLGLACGLDIAVGACACIGAAAFLGVSMQMPLTAIALMIGFTQLAGNSVPALLVACSSAWATALWSREGMRIFAKSG